MPYIKQKDREWMDSYIDNLIEGLDEARRNDEGEIAKDIAGDLNYIISTLIWTLFDRTPSYTQGNSFLGVLSAVAAEFYRRKLAPYEDKKIIDNGDIERN